MSPCKTSFFNFGSRSARIDSNRLPTSADVAAVQDDQAARIAGVAASRDNRRVYRFLGSVAVFAGRLEGELTTNEDTERRCLLRRAFGVAVAVLASFQPRSLRLLTPTEAFFGRRWEFGRAPTEAPFAALSRLPSTFLRAHVPITRTHQSRRGPQHTLSELSVALAGGHCKRLAT